MVIYLNFENDSWTCTWNSKLVYVEKTRGLVSYFTKQWKISLYIVPSHTCISLSYSRIKMMYSLGPKKINKDDVLTLSHIQIRKSVLLQFLF